MLDIKLKEVNGNEGVINRIRKIFLWTFQGITLLSVILVLTLVNENKLMILVIIALVYVNIMLHFKAAIRNFRKIVIWKLLEEGIEAIEKKEKSIEEVQRTIGDENDIKPLLGNQFWRLVNGINKVLEKVKICEDNISKNEKMNIDLIKNVSNKLDNPLNAITTNIEVLKGGNENEGEILDILQEKSSKLKNIIEELFEASKLTSGDINIDLEEIEIVSLIRQSIVEYKEKIDKSNMILKVNLPKEKVSIKANGEKIWRAFDILIGNILKHSLENSRIYIELREVEDNVIISLRNTSKRELNIGPDELIKLISNSNDDSTGLGLEIAKNLVEIQGGSFNLDIEADLFKVELVFPISKESNNGEGGESC